MVKYSLDDIKEKVDEFALIITVPSELLPTYGQQKWDAHPYIEIDNLGLMCYVISERGKEFERKSTDQIDELLYWVFADVTFTMSVDHEVKNRIEDKDCRRIMFEKQEELLGKLSITWKERENSEHQEILRNHPFDDLAGLRATFCRQLREQGHSEKEITKIAYQKYPK